MMSPCFVETLRGGMDCQSVRAGPDGLAIRRTDGRTGDFDRALSPLSTLGGHQIRRRRLGKEAPGMERAWVILFGLARTASPGSRIGARAAGPVPDCPRLPLRAPGP